VTFGRISRYLLGSVLKSWFIVAAVLLLVLVVQQIASLLERIVDRQIAPEIMWQALGWATLANLPTILPVSLLLGVILALGRLASDSELTAMRACGLSPAQLLVPVFALTLPLAAVQGAIALQFGPDALCSVLKARSQVARTLALGPVKPGVFQAFGGGSVYFVERVLPDGELENVFIERGAEPDEPSVEIILARRGRIEPLLESDLLRLRLFDGRRYAGVPGTSSFRVLEFETYEARIPLPAAAGNCARTDSRRSAELLQSNDPAARAEMNWRLSLPVIVIALGLIAVPLSAVKPRQGRFVRVPAALGVFLVYLFSAIGLTAWSARNPGLGPIVFWGLHAAVLLVAVLWLGAQQGLWGRGLRSPNRPRMESTARP
jgi:lipopolysaccharide export system permease protein